MSCSKGDGIESKGRLEQAGRVRSGHYFLYGGQGEWIEKVHLRRKLTGGRNPAAQVSLYAERKPEHFPLANFLDPARSSLNYLRGFSLTFFSSQEGKADHLHTKKNRGTENRLLKKESCLSSVFVIWDNDAFVS